MQDFQSNYNTYIYTKDKISLVLITYKI